MKNLASEAAQLIKHNRFHISRTKVNAWLLLQDARQSERKRQVAQIYISEHLPLIRSGAETIRAADSTPLQVRDAVLAASF